jgi:hypothetical protein
VHKQDRRDRTIPAAVIVVVFRRDPGRRADLAGGELSGHLA